MKLRTFFLVGLVVFAYLTIALLAVSILLNVLPLGNATEADSVLLGQCMVYLLIAGFICGFIGAVWSITLAIHALASHLSHSYLPQFKQGLGRQIFVIKLILVPYFILAVAAIILLTISGTIGAIIWPATSFWGVGILALSVVAWITAILLVIGSYLYILATAGYAVSRIVIARREHQITIGRCVCFCILAFIPIADVISYPIFLRGLRLRPYVIETAPIS